MLSNQKEAEMAKARKLEERAKLAEEKAKLAEERAKLAEERVKLSELKLHTTSKTKHSGKYECSARPTYPSRTMKEVLE